MFLYNSADISCNVSDGVDGSNFLIASMQMLPTFRPIFLVVKKLLQDYGFNDASNGGLGSYALSGILSRIT
jgi:DNA polymerase sigma